MKLLRMAKPATAQPQDLAGDTLLLQVCQPLDLIVLQPKTNRPDAFRPSSKHLICLIFWMWRQDMNLRPSGYEAAQKENIEP